jgi:transcriptional regulator with XRE-family HTH domain
MGDKEKELLARHVKRLRGKRSHREFAPLVGVAPSTISGWENSTNIPTLENFFKLAELDQLLPEVLLARICGREISTREVEPLSFVIHSMDNTQLPEVLMVIANKLMGQQ